MLPFLVYPTVKTRMGFQERAAGFDHRVGYPLLLLYDAKTPNCGKNNGSKDLGHYSEWPKVADVVIKAQKSIRRPPQCAGDGPCMLSVLVSTVWLGQDRRECVRVVLLRDKLEWTVGYASSEVVSRKYLWGDVLSQTSPPYDKPCLPHFRTPEPSDRVCRTEKLPQVRQCPCHAPSIRQSPIIDR